MKKLISILVAVFLLFSCACAEEIVFQNIPWLSNDSTVLQALRNAGLIREGTALPALSNEDVTIFQENEALDYQPSTLPKLNEYSQSISLKEYVKGKIAGSPLQDINLTFAYDGEYKLITVKVTMLNTDYDSLKTKLTKVYGEGEINTVEDEGIETVIWKGDNNTGVLLYTETEGMDYQLYYGRLDAAEILAQCMSVNPDDISGL